MQHEFTYRSIVLTLDFPRMMTLQVGTKASLYVAFDHPCRCESWIHAGWDQGIKGAVVLRLFWFYAEASLPELRQKHLEEGRGGAITQNSHPASL